MQATAAPAPPAPPQPGVPGTPAPTPPGAVGPAERYEAVKAQRIVLEQQYQELLEQRGEISSELRGPELNDVDRRGLEQRLTDVDKRINDVNAQIATVAQREAEAAGVPLAVQPPPPTPEPLIDEDVVIGGMMMSFALLVPIVIAYARRLWKKAAVVSVVPRDLVEQMQRLEQSMDTIAVEIERLGEGQRFMARVLTDDSGARALGAGAAEPIAVPQRDAVAEHRR